ncbi:MAG: sulfotransferase domain-containing protein [Zetaproteobacteria bacterium]|nr:sulfotransferase domain-containing protein [Zetaproteobacteria bacterium]
MIIDRFKIATKTLLGKNIAGRNALIFQDDVMLTSYPKSGNTWTRFLVANLVSAIPVTFKNIEEIIPDIYLWDNVHLLSSKRPRIMKSHEYYNPRYRKVICIVRDPRDVVVSYWFHKTKFNKIDKDTTLDDFVDKFISGELDGFGSWGENVGSWLGARNNDSSFLLVKYEDLLSDSLQEMKRIANFIGSDCSEGLITKAIENSSLDKMKSLEKHQADDWKVLNNSNKNIPFVRKGESGGWREHLPDKAVERIETKWKSLMHELGYL